MASNYGDVLQQLTAAGLIIDAREGLLTGTPKPRRCKVEGDREKRGWYWLHEIITQSGSALIVGTFGVWQGSNQNTQKVELPKEGAKSLSPDQVASLKRRLAEDRKRAEQLRKGEANRAAERASRTWEQCTEVGESDYLARKAVGAYGVRFSPSGALVIPMLDVAGSIHGLQVIRARKVARETQVPEKQYWPSGVATKGHFHLLGAPTGIVLIAEGYATAATLHMATSLPVAVAFDAGNITPVATALRKRYKRARILICADDDAFAKCQHCKARLVLAQHPVKCPACEKDHGRINTGIVAASTAAVEVGGAFIAPIFADQTARIAAFLERGIKATDFNDLQHEPAGGANIVNAQIQTRLSELGWDIGSSPGAANYHNGAGGSAPLQPIRSENDLLRRFSLVYSHGGAAFDHHEHQLVSLSDMRDACSNKYIHRGWMENHSRKIVRITEVGFDPACADPAITCNLWAGWPTVPSNAGKCDKLLELLRYMCSNDRHAEKLYQWVLAWIAYPIQHPGAKMKTTIVMHGPQGTGKNMFFEALMSIYGRYGRVIDQSAIEDRFNDWASGKLFLIADEVVARSDLYHVKNKLKAFITGEWVRINPKNMSAYDERNHVNLVFLSNEGMPVILDEDDRRHAVIWTADQLPREFYKLVLAELAGGGVAALHDYLLHLDLGDFNSGTLPPITDAKDELISQSLDSTQRFYYALEAGDVGAVKLSPALSQDIYDLYKFWCQRTGERAAPLKRLLNVFDRRLKVRTVRKRWEDVVEVRGPHSIVMLDLSVAPPEGMAEAKWLGDCIKAFRAAAKDYRGTGNEP